MLTCSPSLLNLQTACPWCSTPMPVGDPQWVQWTALFMNQCFPLPPKLGRIDLHPIHSKRLPTEIPMCIWVAPILLSFEVKWALSFYLESAPEQQLRHYTSSQMSLSGHLPTLTHTDSKVRPNVSSLWALDWVSGGINIYGITDKQLLSLNSVCPWIQEKDLIGEEKIWTKAKVLIEISNMMGKT